MPPERYTNKVIVRISNVNWQYSSSRKLSRLERGKNRMLTAMAATWAMIIGIIGKWMLKNSQIIIETRVRVKKIAILIEFRNTNFLLSF